MQAVFNSWLTEPRVENPPRRVWRDWVLLAAVWMGTGLELVLRNDLNTPVMGAAFVLLLSPAVLWRRIHPLKSFIAVFGGILLYDLIGVVAGYEPLNFGTPVLMLTVLYALSRWGSGRDMAAGLPLIVALAIVTNILDDGNVGDFIGGFVVLGLVIAVGLVVRYRGRFREQSREQVRILERERLARELHDTVAHHMSAIAIQAQAGRFVAQNGSLEGATEALEVIEEQASRTLSEMRMIVGALRDTNAPVAMVPQHGIADIEALASSAGSPIVRVDLAQEVRGASHRVGAAVYRIAQESITNARSHARNASEVHVQVSANNREVHITITDDGAPTAGTNPHGFGLIGMKERAALLGGTLTAGPQPTGGWMVQATLPRQNDS